MKISEIEVGKEYGVLDSPGRNDSLLYGRLPRRVSVEKIVTVKEPVYHSLSPSLTRNMRRVVVKFLDRPQTSMRNWADAIEQAEKGSQLVVDARKVVAPWEKLHDGVRQRHENEQLRENKQKELAARLRKMRLGDTLYVRVNATSSNKLSGSLEMYGSSSIKTVENLIELLELGFAAKKAQRVAK